MIINIFIVVACVLLDQVTKWLVLEYLDKTTTFPLIEDILHFTYVENPGAAFGMLADNRWVFMIFSVVGIVALLVWLALEKPRSLWVRSAAAMIIGGGIGNMIDRVAYGYVIDFIDCRFIDFYVFNVADSFVCVGCALLIVCVLYDEIRAAKAKKAAASETLTDHCEKTEGSGQNGKTAAMNDRTEFEPALDEACQTFSYTADGTEDRLDKFLAEKTGMSRSAVQRLIEDGGVTVGAKSVPKKYSLSAGEVIEVTVAESGECEASAENIPLDVVYEDGDIIIVNKPCGMVVHPAPGHNSGTLVNALLWHCGDSLSGIGGVARPGIVHRIDKDTSGLICVAKNDASHTSLALQLQDHSMHREYRLITVGGLKEDSGTIDAPIGRHPTDRKKMAVIKGSDKKSRHAVTHYRVLERFSGFTYAEAVLETGRTHQIRVHMSYVGHPLMGDELYGGGHTKFEKNSVSLIHGQMLHATALILRHPRTGESMRFETALPEDFQTVLEKLRKI